MLTTLITITRTNITYPPQQVTVWSTNVGIPVCTCKKLGSTHSHHSSDEILKKHTIHMDKHEKCLKKEITTDTTLPCAQHREQWYILLMCTSQWKATQIYVHKTVNSDTNLTCKYESSDTKTSRGNHSEQQEHHTPHLCTSQWPQSSAGRQRKMPTGWAEYLHKKNRDVWVCNQCRIVDSQ